jgi:hypothetical protein
MKTILRKISTGLYFQGPDEWTSNPGDAFNFRSIDRALTFIKTWNLKEVELAFAFKDHAAVKCVPHEQMAVKYCED